MWKRNFPFVIKKVSSCIRCQCIAGPEVCGAIVRVTAPIRLSVLEPSSRMRIFMGPISRSSVLVVVARFTWVVPAILGEVLGMGEREVVEDLAW